MDDTVFTLFTNSPYTFLTIAQKGQGNTVQSTTAATGIVKLRDGMTQADNVETRDSSSTVHIKPSEPFVAALDGNLVGHGIRAVTSSGDTVDYRIIGQTVGKNFATDEVEHYRVTVKKESLAWQPSALPLT